MLNITSAITSAHLNAAGILLKYVKPREFLVRASERIGFKRVMKVFIDLDPFLLLSSVYIR
jgi:hypothetical protein